MTALFRALSPYLRGDGLLIEVFAFAICLIGLAILSRRLEPLVAAVTRAAGWAGRRRWLAPATVGGVSLAMVITLTAIHLPQPAVTDEFSYLLAADTFARGRLANPTHPLWEHFEAAHVLHHPTYASKYPPGQGLALAAGQALGGHPIVGVWFSTALACAAICWMLQAWFPPRWALLGGLIAALHRGIQDGWGQNYWGGSVALLGGALVFGALPRIVRLRQCRHAAVIALGLVVLANSRPLEGLVVGVAAVAFLAYRFSRPGGPPIGEVMRRVVLPMLAVLVPSGIATASYNAAVTGHPLRMPYRHHSETYDACPILLWQPLPGAKRYSSPNLKRYSLQVLSEFRYRRTLGGYLDSKLRQFRDLGQFYLGFLLTLPLLAFPSSRKGPWIRFAGWTCALLLVPFLQIYCLYPHYAAPAAGLGLALVLHSMRHLGRWSWRGLPIGQLTVRSIVLSLVLLAIAKPVGQWYLAAAPAPDAWHLHRASILGRLERLPGKHLVLVRYRLDCNPNREWVYNGAEIDRQKVVWAHELGLPVDLRLLAYFRGRTVWVVNADSRPPVLEPYHPDIRDGGAAGELRPAEGSSFAPTLILGRGPGPG